MGAIVRATMAYVLVVALVRLWARGSGSIARVPATVTTSSEWLVLVLCAGVALAALAGGSSSLLELALGGATILSLHRLHAWLAHRGIRGDT